MNAVASASAGVLAAATAALALWAGAEQPDRMVHSVAISEGLSAGSPVPAAPAADGMPAPAQAAPACRNVRYGPVEDFDEKFHFARARFGEDDGGLSSFGGRRRGGYDPPWHHDYPASDCQILSIMEFVTLLDTSSEHHVIVDFDDPALFQYPVLYVSEPGMWALNESEIEGLRSYILKGGFLIFDDFSGSRDFQVFEWGMRQAIPNLEIVEIDGTADIYNSFFEVEDPHAVIDITGGGVRASYFALYNGDDPTGRMIGIANWNQDIGEFWEYNAQGLIAIDLSNEAFKLGVNYIIYALTR